MTVPAIGQAQAAQPPAQAEQPRVTTQQPQAQPQPQPQPAVEEAARPPAAEPASLPVRMDTPVRVRTNSWIELRAPNGDVLAQTYVRAGESYVVPAGIAYRIIDARLLGPADLVDGRLGIGGQRVGHGLDRDRRIAADRDGPDHDAPRLAAHDLSLIHI